MSDRFAGAGKVIRRAAIGLSIAHGVVVAAMLVSGSVMMTRAHRAAAQARGFPRG